jgi:hypothetical protein
MLTMLDKYLQIDRICTGNLTHIYLLLIYFDIRFCCLIVMLQFADLCKQNWLHTITVTENNKQMTHLTPVHDVIKNWNTDVKLMITVLRKVHAPV